MTPLKKNSWSRHWSPMPNLILSELQTIASTQKKDAKTRLRTCPMMMMTEACLGRWIFAVDSWEWDSEREQKQRRERVSDFFIKRRERGMNKKKKRRDGGSADVVTRLWLWWTGEGWSRRRKDEGGVEKVNHLCVCVRERERDSVWIK